MTYSKQSGFRSSFEESEPDLKLETPIFIDQHLEVNPDGILNLMNTVYMDPEGDVQTFSVAFYRIIDNVLDYGSEDLDHNHLYSIANELTSESERVREVADRIETSTANVADLFNTSYTISAVDTD